MSAAAQRFFNVEEPTRSESSADQLEPGQSAQTVEPSGKVVVAYLTLDASLQDLREASAMTAAGLPRLHAVLDDLVISVKEALSGRPSDQQLAAQAHAAATDPEALDPEALDALRAEVRAGLAEGFEPMRRLAEAMAGMMRKASETAGKLRQLQASRVR